MTVDLHILAMFDPNISQVYWKVTCNSLPARLLADQAKSYKLFSLR